VGADHDPSVECHLLEREPHRRRRTDLGRWRAGAAEPARAGKRRPLRRPRVVLTEAEPAFVPGPFRARLARGLGHWPAATGSAAASTSSITSTIASSMFPFSITGTPCLSARPRM